MTNMIILAGGRGSRLGPLTATGSKALVSFASRPMLAHHLRHALDLDIEHVTIVASPATRSVIEDFVAHVGYNDVVTVDVVEQRHPKGPAHATYVGSITSCLTLDEDEDADVIIVMCDTHFDELPGGSEWCGVAPAPTSRTWCVFDVETESYVERRAEFGDPVCVGLYRFASVRDLHRSARDVARDAYHQAEVPMSALLNEYPGLPQAWVPSWRDVGDLRALRQARRTVRCRGGSAITLTDRGTVVKTTTRTRFEASWLGDVGHRTQLAPQVTRVWRDSYEMEQLDLPTLAEILLYHDVRPDVWQTVLDDVLCRLQSELWNTSEIASGAARKRALKMYRDKPVERLRLLGADVPPGFADLVERALPRDADDFVEPFHGDLNFTNIMHGLGTDIVKLLDPRGDVRGDVAYEFAKLRYSYRSNFAAIVHDLFTLDPYHALAHDERICDALDEVLRSHVPPGVWERLDAITVTMLYSALPLHESRQRQALRHEAEALMKEIT